MALILGEMTLIDLLIIVVGLIILWVIVSIPAYLAGKLVTGGKSTLGDAMLATLAGPIVYAITLIAADFFLGAIIGPGAYLWALIFAFIAWIWVYKASFRTGWLAATGIALLSLVVFAVLSIILHALFGLAIPAPFFPGF